ncbi:MAG: DUF4271 domain-containing protein [Chitinophagales bacterium]|nr:DUF4271 domain-containing protein [Chitinophagales bacterium]MDW8418393.1 DUF4271 domain-containing protein [Chitinophagales bacterium]
MNLKGILAVGMVLISMMSHATVSDSSAIAAARADSALQAMRYRDSLLAIKYGEMFQGSYLLEPSTKTYRFDVQQYKPPRNNFLVFLLLLLVLGIVTYLKTSFSKDLSDVIQSAINNQTAHQVFRTQTPGLTLSSLLLHINFVLVICMFMRFVLIKFFHVTSLDSLPGILFLIFLFTFFYVLKFISVRFFGYVFEVRETSEEYIFIFSTMCKTLGLSLIPAIFTFYVAPERYFHIIFYINLFIIGIFVTTFVWRALSTSSKWMYRSIYHYIIYVCTQEAATLLLFFKLLTKTVS